MIFTSPFQINKIINPHLYFDGTFVFPSGFMQMIIILYYDNEIKKRAPGAYILLNNKKEKSYIKVLINLKSIITLENTLNLKLITYSSDYEISLSNALERIFPHIRHIGCYYHYCDNILDNIKNKITSCNEVNIITKFKEEIKKLKTDILTVPFKYQNNNIIIDNTFNTYTNEIYDKFKHYYKSQWLHLFKNGTLNYAYITKEQRSNSFIENYNRRIKTVLSKY